MASVHPRGSEAANKPYTDEDQIEAAKRHVRNVLDLTEAAYGRRAMMAYAAGMCGGIADHVVEKFGPRAGYDLLSGTADEIITHQAQQGWIP